MQATNTINIHQGDYGIACLGDGYTSITTENVTSCTIVTIVDENSKVGLMAHIDNIQRAKDFSVALDDFVSRLGEKSAITCRIQGGLKFRWARFILPSVYVRHTIVNILSSRPELNVKIIENDYTQGIRGTAFHLDVETGVLTENVTLLCSRKTRPLHLYVDAFSSTLLVMPIAAAAIFLKSPAMAATGALLLVATVNLGVPWLRLRKA